MARIQPLDPAETPDDVRAALENLPPLNIFRTLAHAETAFRPFLRFGGAVLTRMEPWIELAEEALKKAVGEGALDPALARDAAYGVITFYLGVNLLTHLDPDIINKKLPEITVVARSKKQTA